MKDYTDIEQTAAEAERIDYVDDAEVSALSLAMIERNKTAYMELAK